MSSAVKKVTQSVTSLFSAGKARGKSPKPAPPMIDRPGPTGGQQRQRRNTGRASTLMSDSETLG